MIRAVVQRDLHVHDRVAGDHAGLHRALDTGVDRRNVLLRDRAADDGVDELVTFAGLVRFDLDLDVTVLTFTTRLTRILGVDVRQTANRLLIRDLRSADVGFHLELAEQTVHDDFEVQLAHTGDNGLPGFFVRIRLERRILFRQLRQGNAHLLLTGFGLRLDRDTDNRLRELHGFQDDRVFLIAQRVTGGGGFETHRRGDVARKDLFEILPVIRVHLQNTPESLVGILVGVVHRRTGLHRARVHAEEAELTDIGVGRDLERQRRERLFVRRVTLFFFLGIRVHALDSRNVRRRRHVVHNGVQQLLHALVAVRRTAGDRHHGVRQGGFADAFLDLVDRQFLTREVFFHERVILLGDVFDQLIMILLSFLFHVVGDLFLADILALIVIIDIRFHGDQVNDALEERFRSDRKLDRDSVTFEALFHHVNHAVKIRAHDVHLIDVRHAGNLIFVRLTPHRLRLGLHAALGAEHRHGAVQDAQRALHFHREIHVTRGVNDVDSMILPETGRRRGRDRDAALLLLFHPVHRRRTVVRLTDFVVDTGVIQDAFGRRCFTGINVRHDADISGFFQSYLPSHVVLLLGSCAAHITI